MKKVIDELLRRARLDPYPSADRERNIAEISFKAGRESVEAERLDSPDREKILGLLKSPPIKLRNKKNPVGEVNLDKLADYILALCEEEIRREGYKQGVEDANKCGQMDTEEVRKAVAEEIIKEKDIPVRYAHNATCFDCLERLREKCIGKPSEEE